jgi:tetratricopeptide (TPR) repeat protein
LEQAAAYIKVVGGGCEKYLARYRRQGLGLLEKGKLSTDYPKTIATTWKLSFDALKDEAPASVELLNAAAFLVPDSIPIEIFTLGGSELGSVLAQALDDAAQDPLTFWEVLEPLERYSLVDRLPDDAFRLHRLTQDVVKDSLGEDRRRDWAERVVYALNAAFPFIEFENWRLCERLQSNARAALELILAYKLESAEAGRLLNQTGSYAQVRGNLIEGRLFREQALELQERVLGVEHLDTLISRDNLAAILSLQGDLAGARRLQEETLAILERVLGVEHLDTLISRNNLAETLHSQGDLTEARRLQKETLAILERVLGVEHPDTLKSKANLAVVLEDLIDARKLEEEVMEARERLLGVEHPDTSLALWNLLTTVQRLGDTEAFEQLICKLRWILNRDEASIASAQQRDIRQRLLDLLNGA